MDLGDGARRHRFRVDALEDVLPGHAELLLHHPNDLLLGEWRNVVLEGRELLDELLGEQVGTGRKDLAELRERRPQLLERLPEAPGPDPDGLLVLLRPPGEQLPEAELGHDLADVCRTSEELALYYH